MSENEKEVNDLLLQKKYRVVRSYRTRHPETGGELVSLWLQAPFKPKQNPLSDTDLKPEFEFLLIKTHEELDWELSVYLMSNAGSEFLSETFERETNRMLFRAGLNKFV